MALVGFLDKKTEEFVRELWALLADAQSNATGVPTVFLDKKKNEIEQRARVNVRRTRSKERDITRTHEGKLHHSYFDTANVACIDSLQVRNWK